MKCKQDTTVHKCVCAHMYVHVHAHMCGFWASVFEKKCVCGAFAENFGATPKGTQEKFDTVSVQERQEVFWGFCLLSHLPTV